MIVLVINCGSSSIKYQLYKMPEKAVLAKGLVEKIGESGSRLIHKSDKGKHEAEVAVRNHKAGMSEILRILTDATHGVIEQIGEIGAVGHRVVHGGEAYSGSVLIDDKVLACVEDFCDLAPLHNPPNLTGIREAQEALPGVPMVAVFDTAFHQTIPPHAYLYALPHELYEKYRVRKYGFHGTSHAFVTHRTAELLGKPLDQTNIITCHLGNGGSMAAVKNGKGIDTTMGMTPLPGVVMGTRCGDIDPAIIFYLLGKDEFADPKKIDNLLNKKSGLLGISGVSNDMRDLEELAANNGGHPRAQLALDIFNYRLKFYIGAYMAILGQVDAIVFTGGIGENGSHVRSASCGNLSAFGIEIDEAKNKGTIRGKEGIISTSGSKVKVMVVPTDEEGWIATETYELAK